MREIGIVDEVSGKIARVRIAKKSACGENCASCKAGCASRERILKVKNPIGAVAGQRVILELAEGRVLYAAFLVYIMPILVFLASYFIEGLVFREEWQKILASTILTIVSVFIVKIIDKKSDESYMAVISEICE